MITLNDVFAARLRIAPYIVRTPLLRAFALDAVLGCEVYLKAEGFQKTGSFKLRGAANRLLMLSEEERRRGVVCASSGNHAQGVACAAAALGIDAIIVVPTNCNPVKLAGIRALGGRVVTEGTLSSQREAKAIELAQAEGRTIVHPYADDGVRAGQGTLALEILEDLPQIDAVVVPIGGGGLITGVATAVKGVNPAVRVIGAEPSGAPRYAASREAGSPQSLDKVDTIADGTRTDRAQPDNFAAIERLVDDLVQATEDEIRAAMREVVARGKLVAEPSSVLGVAAAMAGRLPVSRADKVCFVLSGANNDLSLLTETLA